MVDTAKVADVDESVSEKTEETSTAAAPVHSAAQKPAPQKLSGNTPFAFKDFRLDFSHPLPEFARKNIPAFQATMPKQGDKPFIVYIYHHQHWCRYNQLARIAELKNASIMKPVWWGAVMVPSKGMHFAIIVEQPLGSAVIRDVNNPPRLSDTHLIEKFVRPLVPLLRQFNALSLTHRAIHPLNLYYADTDESKIVVGPCYLLPPGMDTPLAYEPIETMMADPAARGDGVIDYDLYALGLTLYALTTGNLWHQSTDERDLLEQKIMQGSHAALVGPYRLPPVIQEATKGLLNDDDASRWSLDELDDWASGSTIVPRQHKPVKKATRTFDIGDEAYVNIRSLAYNLHRHWQKALEIIASNQLENWLRRSLGYEIVANNVERAIRTNVRAPSNQVHYRTSFGIAALDPQGPIYYRQFHGHIDGIGHYLAYNFDDQQKRQVVGELIRGKVPSFWLKCQHKIRPEWVSLTKIFDTLALIVDRPGTGYGIERCLYELNPHMPCLSPMLADMYITNPADILPALEKIAQKGDVTKTPIDRHIAAYLATHISAISETILYALGDTKSASAPIVATLNIYTILQQRYNIASLPHLTAWFAKILQPAVQTFYNKERQKRIAESMSKAAKTANLNSILKVIDNQEEKKRDLNEFVRANGEYLIITKQLEELAERRRRIPDIARDATIKFAPLFAGMMATTGLLFYILT